MTESRYRVLDGVLLCNGDEREHGEDVTYGALSSPVKILAIDLFDPWRFGASQTLAGVQIVRMKALICGLDRFERVSYLKCL